MNLQAYLSAPPWPPVGPIPIGDRLLIFYPGGSPNGWHKLSTMQECERLAAFYMAGYKFDTSADALIVGGLVHLGLAHLYAKQGLTVPRNEVHILGQALMGTGVRDKLYGPLEAIAIAAQITEVENEALVKLSVSMIEDYVRLFALSHSQEFRVRAIEHPVSISDWAPELPPYTMLLDLMVETWQGRRVVIDHKTTSSTPSEALIEEFAMSGQFYGQKLAADRIFGQSDTTVEVNLLSKRGGGVRRRPLALSSYILDGFPAHVAQGLRHRAALVAAKPPKVDPYAWTPRLSGGSGGGCKNAYRLCSAVELCRGGPGRPYDELARPQGRVDWSREND